VLYNPILLPQKAYFGYWVQLEYNILPLENLLKKLSIRWAQDSGFGGISAFYAFRFIGQCSPHEVRRLAGRYFFASPKKR